MVLQKFEELQLDLFFWRYLIKDVGTIEGCAHDMGISEVDLLNDVLLDLLRSRCREGGHGNAGKQGGDAGKSEIVGPKVVTPLRNTVRLVDGKERKGQRLQRLDELRHGEPFRRYIEELDLLGLPPAKDVRYLLLLKRAGDERGRNAVFLCRVHLVLHQRDEGADDDGCSLHHDGWQLVAQGLPAARGHDRKNIPAAENAPDDVLLVRPEGLIAEDCPEGIVHCGIAGSRGSCHEFLRYV